nr:hypothetical protein [Tanacetum cinerariifolium]
MAILLEYEKQPESIKKPFNSVLDTAEPLKFLKKAFVANETFMSESIVKNVNRLVRYVKEKLDDEEKKRKKKSNGVGLRVENKRVKEGENEFDYLSALSHANNSIYGEIPDFRIMVGLLVRVGLFKDAEWWYVGVDELGKCVELYYKMRGLDLVSSVSCYGSLVDYLVFMDAIVSGYCEKKDYDDLLSLFSEMDCVPDVAVGNKIIQSLCQNLRAEEAFEFMKKLERLRFTPDAITFGFLIGWSC